MSQVLETGVGNESEGRPSDVQGSVVICSSCGHELAIGDYPFCPHGSIFSENATRFDPIVLFRDGTTGEIYPATHTSDPTPDKHERIEITNMRQADHYVKHFSAIERTKRVERGENTRLFFEERTKERREKMDGLIKSGKLTGRALWLAEKAREFADRKHDKRFSTARSLDSNVHFQALSFNSSNRMPYSSKETGFRDRRS